MIVLDASNGYVIPKIGVVMVAILLAIIIVSFIAMVATDDSTFKWFTCVSLGLLLVAVFLTVRTTEHYMKYKVTFDDEYTVNQLYEKYDVIENEGKIFTIREKEKK